MPKTIATGLKTALANGASTLARLFTITRKDGTIYRFTDLDVDVTYLSNVYESSTGCDVATINVSSGRSPQTTELRVMFTTGFLQEIDAIRGKFDDAKMDIWFIDYSDLGLGHGVLLEGNLGSFENTHLGYGSFEIQSLWARMRKPIGEVYSPECRADLGDSKCTISLASVQQLLTVTTVLSQAYVVGTIPLIAGANYFLNGVCEWQTGNNTNVAMEIISDGGTGTTRTIRLALPMGGTIQVGDTAKLYAGCDKTIATCKNKFNNAINFQGEPAVPGADFAQGYPVGG